MLCSSILIPQPWAQSCGASLAAAEVPLFSYHPSHTLLRSPYPPKSHFPTLTYISTNTSRSYFPIGIGLEFVRQLLARGDQVIAAVRDPMSASELWQLTANSNRPGACEIHQCDVKSEQSIDVSSVIGGCHIQRMEKLILTGLCHSTAASAEAWHRLLSAQRRCSGLS